MNTGQYYKIIVVGRNYLFSRKTSCEEHTCILRYDRQLIFVVITRAANFPTFFFPLVNRFEKKSLER